MFKITIFVRPRDGFNFKDWFEEDEIREEFSWNLDFDEDYEDNEIEDSEMYVLSGMYDEVPIDDIVEILGTNSDLVVEWYSSEVPNEKEEDLSKLGYVEDGEIISIYKNSCGVYSYIKKEPCGYAVECKIMTADEFFNRDPAFW